MALCNQSHPTQIYTAFYFPTALMSPSHKTIPISNLESIKRQGIVVLCGSTTIAIRDWNKFKQTHLHSCFPLSPHYSAKRWHFIRTLSGLGCVQLSQLSHSRLSLANIFLHFLIYAMLTSIQILTCGHYKSALYDTHLSPQTDCICLHVHTKCLLLWKIWKRWQQFRCSNKTSLHR